MKVTSGVDEEATDETMMRNSMVSFKWYLDWKSKRKTKQSSKAGTEFSRQTHNMA